MRLLLDTVALIFAVESPERFTKRATAILQNTENILELAEPFGRIWTSCHFEVHYCIILCEINSA